MATDIDRTPIPPGIEVPDQIRTRLGTLRLFDGFPDDATTQVLFDNLDFQRAVEAYLLALPALDMAVLRRAILAHGPANSTMCIWEDLVRPRTVILTPNNNTSYSLMWIDLHDGPLVLETPPRVLGYLNDSWERWVVDVGMTGADKGEGGAYLLLPPGYDGPVPDGYFVVRPRTYGLWAMWRGFLDAGGDPHPGVEVVRARTRAYPLGQAGSPQPLRFINISPAPMVAVPPADFGAWELLNEVIQSESNESSDPLTLGVFASIGIQHGMPFAPDDRMRAILTEAAAVGNATARALAYRFREPEAYLYPGSAWRTLFLGSYRFQRDGVAQLDAAAQCYFVAEGISPSEEARMVGAGSQYAIAFVDADGRSFDGARTYKLRVPPDVPASSFWSVLVYDTQTRSMLQTGQQWPAVSSQDRDLMANNDRSVDVYFGPEPPGNGRNWIQTLPGKSWWVIFRLYGPLDPWFDKAWRLPDVGQVR